MSNLRRSTASIWTLSWILLAITIAAIVVVAVLSVTGSTNHHGRSRGEAEISAIEAGLESYKADHGDYPAGTNLTPSPAGNNAFLFRALNSTNDSGKVYVDFNKKQTNASGCLVDPFGNLYGYQYPGDPKRSGTNFPDLWSFSDDRSTTNTNLWIKNW